MASLNANCFQVNNEPGISPVIYGIIAKSIEGSWPKESDINEFGEIQTLPTYKNGAMWAAYECPNNTAKLDIDSGGENGYQGGDKQTLMLALAGMEKAIIAEQKKHTNAGSLWIAPFKGGEYVVAGSTKNPIFTKWKFTSGQKYGDKRGFTVTGEGEVEWAFATLTEAQMALLPIAPIL